MATVKQKVAFKEVVNGSTLTAAMKKAKYSPKSAKRTNKLTATKGWGELVEDFISDKKLAKVHGEGLSATTYFNEIVGRDSKGAPEYNLKQIPDFSVRHKYLESGYKLKGRYAERTGDRTLVVIIAGQSSQRYGVNATERVPVAQEPGNSSG